MPRKTKKPTEPLPERVWQPRVDPLLDEIKKRVGTVPATAESELAQALREQAAAIREQTKQVQQAEKFARMRARGMYSPNDPHPDAAEFFRRFQQRYRDERAGKPKRMPLTTLQEHYWNLLADGKCHMAKEMCRAAPPGRKP